MYCIYIIIALVVFGIVSVILYRTSNRTKDNWSLTATVSFLFAVVIGLLTIYNIGISVPQEINKFENQKAYITSHTAVEPLENAALTNKKIELNDWLFNAQWEVKHRKGWTFYPDTVLELEAIQ